MVFWLGILVAGAFTWFAIKMGFYETWAMLFNILISIYLAVFLGPIIANIVPVSGGTAYNNALCMMATAIVSFLILHSISYTFLTGQFSIPFPKIFDTLGAGSLGFLGGFLIWSFVVLLVSITPISQNNFVKEIGFARQFEQSKTAYICWWGNLVNNVVSHKASGYTAEHAISGLFKKVKKVRTGTAKEVKPAEPGEPNEVEIITNKQKQLGPPPEAGAEDI